MELGGYGKSPYLLLNYAVNLRLLEKSIKKKKLDASPAISKSWQLSQ